RFYFEIRNTVNLFNNFMSKFIKSTMIKNKNFLNQYTKESFVIVDLLLGTIQINCRFSWMLERIGLAGESYRYLMRSFDPLIQLYDRENDTGEIQFNPERYQLFNGLIRGMIRLGKPQIRE